MENRPVCSQKSVNKLRQAGNLIHKLFAALAGPAGQGAKAL